MIFASDVPEPIRRGLAEDLATAFRTLADSGMRLALDTKVRELKERAGEIWARLPRAAGRLESAVAPAAARARGANRFGRRLRPEEADIPETSDRLYVGLGCLKEVEHDLPVEAHRERATGFWV